MKEILKYIGLTLIFFMVYSCSGGEDILQEDRKKTLLRTIAL